MDEYFEDVAVGDSREFGSYEVTAEEIVDFAERYDPQPFHLDPEAAQDSLFGGLVASGWHTAAVCMRLVVDNLLSPETSLGARGVDELRWHRPVRPGDTLSVRTEVLDKRPSESNPGMGHVRSRLEGYNQDDELVVSWVALGMVRKREPDAAD